MRTGTIKNLCGCLYINGETNLKLSHSRVRKALINIIVFCKVLLINMVRKQQKNNV